METNPKYSCVNELTNNRITVAYVEVQDDAPKTLEKTIDTKAPIKPNFTITEILDATNKSDQVFPIFIAGNGLVETHRLSKTHIKLPDITQGSKENVLVTETMKLDKQVEPSDNLHARVSSYRTILVEHCHRSRDAGVNKSARKKLIIASCLCVVFMMIEAVGGYLSNSLAIATDAAHLLTDFAGFMISLSALCVAGRPVTRRMTYGWYRAEVLGALTSVLLIWVVTGVLVYMAIQRVVTMDFVIRASIMMITSAVGVIVNLIMGFALYQSDEKIETRPPPSPQVKKKTDVKEAEKLETVPEPEAVPRQSVQSANENINVRAAFVHVLGDLLQSIGVFTASVIIYFKPSWRIVDPICTFMFSILVMFTTFNIMKDVILVLMEGAPKSIDYQQVVDKLMGVKGVKKVHSVRIIALSLDKIALTAHIAIDPEENSQKVLHNAICVLHENFCLFDITLQIEQYTDLMEDCSQCILPLK